MERRRRLNASANITGQLCAGNNRFLLALFFGDIKQAFAIRRRRSHEILIEPLTRDAATDNSRSSFRRRRIGHFLSRWLSR